MRKQNPKPVAEEILENRPYVNFEIALNRSRYLTFLAGVGALFLFAVSFIEENRIYTSYALFTILQVGLILLGVHFFRQTQRSKWLLFAVVSAIVTYLLERHALGAFYEPLKGVMPTLVNQPYKSPGIVKGLAVMMPTFYFWTKVLFGIIWTIIFLNALRLKKIRFQ